MKKRWGINIEGIKRKRRKKLEFKGKQVYTSEEISRTIFGLNFHRSLHVPFLIL